jgi:hypothetical protein
MVYSTRQKDYNDPSVQNLGDRQQGGASNQAWASQPFNLEAKFRKLQKLVHTQAKEIAALNKKEQQRKGKEKVVEDDPAHGVEKQSQQATRNLGNNPV